MLSWPNYGWDVERGAVADVCPHCERIGVFSVEEHMYYWTLFGLIRISGDLRAARRRVCWDCGWWKFLPFPRYAEWLPVREVERLPRCEIVRITNPELYREKMEDEGQRRRR